MTKTLRDRQRVQFDREAVKLYKKHKTLKAVATHLGCSHSTARAALLRAGLLLPRQSRTGFLYDAEITRRTQAGESFTDIAADLGLTRERVRQIAARNGLTAVDWRVERALRNHKDRLQNAVMRRQDLRTKVRTRQRARRLYLIQTVRDLTTELGESPTLRQLTKRSGMHPSHVAQYFVGRRTGDWAHRAFNRLYRLAGAERRDPGFTGWTTNSKQKHLSGR